MERETKFSPLGKLVDLEAVINTRTPVWDIGRNGDVRIKLDTDVNGQEWYVIWPNDGRCPIKGIVPCWAFPHFNGSFDTYGYEPVEYCFKTLASLLEAYPTGLSMWAYDEAEYAQRRDQTSSTHTEFNALLGDIEIDLGNEPEDDNPFF